MHCPNNRFHCLVSNYANNDPSVLFDAVVDDDAMPLPGPVDSSKSTQKKRKKEPSLFFLLTCSTELPPLPNHGGASVGGGGRRPLSPPLLTTIHQINVYETHKVVLEVFSALWTTRRRRRRRQCRLWRYARWRGFFRAVVSPLSVTAPARWWRRRPPRNRVAPAHNHTPPSARCYQLGL